MLDRGDLETLHTLKRIASHGFYDMSWDECEDECSYLFPGPLQCAYAVAKDWAEGDPGLGLPFLVLTPGGKRHLRWLLVREVGETGVDVELKELRDKRRETEPLRQKMFIYMSDLGKLAFAKEEEGQ